MHDTVDVGHGCSIDDGATVGYEHDSDAAPTEIGPQGTVRAGTIIYCDVTIGEGFATGHNVLVREETTIGDDVLLGTGAVIDELQSLGHTANHVKTHV